MKGNEGLPYRPGIREDTLEANGISRVDAGEARVLAGIHCPGVAIPYRNFHGDPIIDGENDFYRIRLENPTGEKKYHQRTGSGVHVYVPHGLNIEPETEALVIVEGEFKALALFESGIPAVGVSGFYGFQSDDEICEELEEVLEYGDNVNQLLFLGDSDTALNFQFAHAAVRLKRQFPNKRILLPRLAIDGPKGIDDLKEELLKNANNGEGEDNFRRRWLQMVNEAPEVTGDIKERDLAMTLFRRESESLKGFQEEKRAWALHKMAKLASFMDTVEANEVKSVAAQMDIFKRDFTSMVKKAKEKRKRERSTEAVEIDVDKEVWFLPERRQFLLPNAEGRLIPLDERSAKRWLMDKGISKTTVDDGALSPLDSALLKIQREKSVDSALSLAGHRKGIRKFGDHRILVTREANHVEPVKGEWGLLRDVVEALLKGIDGSMTSVRVFYEWLRIFLECQESQIFRNGQVLVLAGPKDCGKSLLQNLLTVLFGGREGRPYQFASGGTSFNADLASAEHLVIEDEVPGGDYAVRRKTGALLKQFAANRFTRIHPKGKDAFDVELLNRLTMTMNDDPQSLGILPPIDESFSDKVILLQCHKRELPRKPKNSEEFKAFRKDLEAQLPAFKHYLLNEFECPEELKSTRFGVIAYQDPQLKAKLVGVSPTDKFRAFLECLFGSLRPLEETGSPRTITSFEIVNGFEDENFACREEARRLLGIYESNEKAVNAVGTFMGNIHTETPGLVEPHRTANTRGWLLNPENHDYEEEIPG